MKKRQIINIINFVRAVEPRVKKDMILPVKKQIELMKKHSLKGNTGDGSLCYLFDAPCVV